MVFHFVYKYEFTRRLIHLINFIIFDRVLIFCSSFIISSRVNGSILELREALNDHIRLHIYIHVCVEFVNYKAYDER